MSEVREYCETLDDVITNLINLTKELESSIQNVRDDAFDCSGTITERDSEMIGDIRGQIDDILSAINHIETAQSYIGGLNDY